MLAVPPDAAATATAQPATELSSSIVLAVPTDYLLDSSGRSRCIDMVQRAAQYNVNRLQFVPTLFWVDEGAEPLPRAVARLKCACMPRSCRQPTLLPHLARGEPPCRPAEPIRRI